MPLVVGDPLERAAVALVEQEQVLVLRDRVDELVEQRGPRGGQRVGIVERSELFERLPPERVQPQVELEEDVLLAREVVVERRLRDAEPVGDLAQRGLVVALVVEELERDVEDPLPRVARAGGRRAIAPSSRLAAA